MKASQVPKYLQNPAHTRQLILLFLLAGFALICVETRYEHQAVLVKKPQAWTPIIYSLTVSIVLILNLFSKHLLPRLALMIFFGGGIIVGMLGFWFHSKGVPFAALKHIADVVFTTPGRLLTDESGTPVLAPLSIIGLSLIGITINLSKVE
jgi:hypothetical protein